MGNRMGCMSSKDSRGAAASRGKRKMTGRSSRRMAAADQELLHRQALAMAIQQHQLSQRMDASLSRRIDGLGGSMSRRVGSTSSRRRDLPESLTHGGKQVPFLPENLETKKIVLVHGEGFGAWCWYKTISLLEEAGLEPVALDLTGSGIDHTDPNSVTTLAEYSKPLMNYLCSLSENEKVILVGHSCAGASISYAVEACPKKILKAIYLSATMVKDGQRPFDVFSEELASADIFLQEGRFLVHGNGRENPATALQFDKQLIKGLYFNQSPTKDIALAAVSMRPIPLAPIMEKVSLTQENYGSVRRYFIQTLDDRFLSPDIQEKMVRENPPQGIFKIKGSDHCPFFSRPQALHKMLLDIAQSPAHVVEPSSGRASAGKEPEEPIQMSE